MTNDDARREISLVRDDSCQYTATNARGGTLRFGSGDSEDFTPVELLLTAIAGCASVDVDLITSRRAEPLTFEVTCGGDKVKEAGGSHMGPIDVTFRIAFPDGPDGDRARQMLPTAVRQSQDRLCTVSRTVSQSTPVEMTAENAG